AEEDRRAEHPGVRVDALQPLRIGTDPDLAGAIGVDGEGVVVGHPAVLRRERGEAAGLRIESTDATGPGRDPDSTRPVFGEGENGVRVQVARRRGVALEPAGRTI